MHRPLAVSAILVTATATATAHAEPAIGIVEARAAAGVATGGPEMSGWRASPASIGVFAAHAISAEPWTWLRGGVFVEQGDVTSVGAAIGPRLALGEWIAGASAQAILAPAKLYGASATLGRRLAIGDAAIVPALEVTFYDAGRELGDDRITAQALFALGVELEAW